MGPTQPPLRFFPKGYLDTGRGAVPPRVEFNIQGDARAPDEDPSPLSSDFIALGEIEEHKDPIGTGPYDTPLGLFSPRSTSSQERVRFRHGSKLIPWETHASRLSWGLFSTNFGGPVLVVRRPSLEGGYFVPSRLFRGLFSTIFGSPVLVLRRPSLEEGYFVPSRLSRGLLLTNFGGPVVVVRRPSLEGGNFLPSRLSRRLFSTNFGGPVLIVRRPSLEEGCFVPSRLSYGLFFGLHEGSRPGRSPFVPSRVAPCSQGCPTDYFAAYERRGQSLSAWGRRQD